MVKNRVTPEQAEASREVWVMLKVSTQRSKCIGEMGRTIRKAGV